MVVSYIVPIIVFLFIGGAAGVMLTIASKAFEVESDESVGEILEFLPGINCGACGLASCEAYAEAVKKGNLAPNLCKPGGIEAAMSIGNFLGIEVKPGERESAFVHCAGPTAEDRFSYSGTETCEAARLYYNGKSNCAHGCLGFGDCARVCSYGAIRFENGVAVVEPQKCWACGLCTRACPNGIISLRKHSERTKVRCSSKMGRDTRQICKHGCMACGVCGKKCLKDAIGVKGNIAAIDYDICIACGVCAVICPTKCIVVEQFFHKASRAEKAENKQ